MIKTFYIILTVFLVTLSSTGLNPVAASGIDVTQEQAVFIAKLQDGTNGFVFDEVKSINLWRNSKIKHEYWVVKVKDKNTNENWTVFVNVNNAKSRKSIETEGIEGATSWRSFDELKAVYVAQLYYDIGILLFKRAEMKGPDIWMVTVLEEFNNTIYKYQVYFNAKTGYSYVTDEEGDSNWISLKELDDKINTEGKYKTPFKNALRDIYPE